MNKIKKYSLTQLAKVHPLLNESEMHILLGGAERRGGYYYFTTEEIRALYSTFNIPEEFESWYQQVKTGIIEGETVYYSFVHYYRISEENYQKLFNSNSEASGSGSNTHTFPSGSEASNSEQSSNGSSESSSSESNNIEDRIVSDYVVNLMNMMLEIRQLSTFPSSFKDKARTMLTEAVRLMIDESGLNMTITNDLQSFVIKATNRYNEVIVYLRFDFIHEDVQNLLI